jgi:hypothetical protein
MDMIDLIKNGGEMLIPDPWSSAVGLGEGVMDLGAAGYDYATGDSDGGNSHLKGAFWDFASSIPGMGGKIAKGMQVMDDTQDISDKGDGDSETDWAGMGAKLGTLAALPLGPLGWAGGAAVGGIAGSLATPKAEGGFKPDMGSLIGKALHPGPFDHYAD